MTWSKAALIEGEIAMVFAKSAKDEIDIKELHSKISEIFPALYSSIRMVLEESPLFIKVGPTTWATANRYEVGA